LFFKQKDRESNTKMPNIGPSSKKKRKGKGQKKPLSFKQKDKESDVNITDAVSTNRYK
jgi:hypothetical protein